MSDERVTLESDVSPIAAHVKDLDDFRLSIIASLRRVSTKYAEYYDSSDFCERGLLLVSTKLCAKMESTEINFLDLNVVLDTQNMQLAFDTVNERLSHLAEIHVFFTSTVVELYHHMAKAIPELVDEILVSEVQNLLNSYTVTVRNGRSQENLEREFALVIHEMRSEAAIQIET